ncbi:hypothetical protein CLOM_g16346, partial [Closterium sp. NIES-68]
LASLLNPIQAHVQHLLHHYSGVFPAYHLAAPPSDRALGHSIRLVPGSTPLVHPMYRMSTVELSEMRRQLEDLLSKGLIRPSTSPYAGPVLFTRKKERRCMTLL